MLDARARYVLDARTRHVLNVRGRSVLNACVRSMLNVRGRSVLDACVRNALYVRLRSVLNACTRNALYVCGRYVLNARARGVFYGRRVRSRRTGLRDLGGLAGLGRCRRFWLGRQWPCGIVVRFRSHADVRVSLWRAGLPDWRDARSRCGSRRRHEAVRHFLNSVDFRYHRLIDLWIRDVAVGIHFDDID